MDTSRLLTSFRSYVDFSDEDFANYLQLVIPFKLQKNQLFYSAGEVPKHSPFILKGCVRQYILHEDGREQTIMFTEEGTWSGQIGSMRSKIPTNVNLQALEDCEILGITLENIDYAMETIPAYQRYFTKKYPIDHALMIERANRLKTEPPETLYLELLDTNPSLILRVPQHYIANYLGVRTETISRIRKKIANR